MRRAAVEGKLKKVESGSTDFSQYVPGKRLLKTTHEEPSL
jgi:hypothetical protein